MCRRDGSPSKIREMASSWAAVSSPCSAESASASSRPSTSKSREDVRHAPLPRPERQGGGGKGTCIEIGDSSGRDGRNGGTRGGFGASRPQTSTRGRKGSRRRSNQRVRVILGESPHSFGGVGHENEPLSTRTSQCRRRGWQN